MTAREVDRVRQECTSTIEFMRSLVDEVEALRAKLERAEAVVTATRPFVESMAQGYFNDVPAEHWMTLLRAVEGYVTA